MKAATIIFVLLALCNVAVWAKHKNQKNKGGCLCSIGMKMCGTNGVTYSGFCALNCDARAWNVPLTVEYDGPCRAKKGLKCMCAPKPDICGSDGTTYDGVCNMNCASARLGVKLRKLHDGPCP